MKLNVHRILRAGLPALLLTLAALPARAGDTLDVTLNGYYRLRGYFFNNLDLQKGDVKNSDGTVAQKDMRTNTSYTLNRMRLEPAIMINENLGVFASMDVIDNVMGGHQAFSPAPLFAGYSSNHQKDLTVADSIQVKRVWAEHKFKFGVLRFGRMPSNFGMGLFSNDGGNGVGLTKKTLAEKWASYFDEDFGDNDGGSTYDRILFATKPGGPESNLLVALYWDHLVEGNIDREGDDVDEYGFVTYYNPKPEENTGNVTRGGVYGIRRLMYKTKSEIYSVSGHFYMKAKPLYTEAELVLLFGASKNAGIPFAKYLEAKFGDVMVSVARVGYDNDMMDARLEIGYSSGDPEAGNSSNGGSLYADCNTPTGVDANGQPTFKSSKCNMKTFNIHGDHNVGLIMFDQALAQNLGPSGFAAGGVINALYVYPTFKYRLSGRNLEGLNLLAAVLWGRSMKAYQFRGVADKPAGSPGNPTDRAVKGDNSTDLGIEVDLGLQYYFTENLRVDFQGGYLLPGDGYPVLIGGQSADPAYALISKFTLVF